MKPSLIFVAILYAFTLSAQSPPSAEVRKAAEQGDAAAQLDLGTAYEYGQGVTQDYAEAANWYRKAADQGDADAQGSFGALFLTGKGVPQDYAEAAKWFRKAAGQDNAAAQVVLGVLYEHGQGVALDYVEATKWLRKAADQCRRRAKRAGGPLLWRQRRATRLCRSSEVVPQSR